MCSVGLVLSVCSHGWTSVLKQLYFGGSNFSYNDDDGGRRTMADK